MHFPTAASLLIAALLLSPVAMSAQTPTPAETAPRKVSIQVTFVTVKTENLDALGVNFDLIVLASSPRTFLAFAEGNIVPQMYQKLTQAAVRMGNHIIALAPMTVSDNVPAVFTVNTQVPINAPPRTLDQGRSGFPQLTSSGQLRGEITLIPQTVPGNLVTLDMLSPVESNQRMRFRTVPSGQQVVMNVATVKARDSTSQGQITSVSGHQKFSHTTELLIFITPTIITEAPEIVTKIPMFVPPTHFLGAATGSPLVGTTFDSSFPGDASSGLLGFGMTKPSDIFRSLLWLDSSHWQSRGSKTGTINKSPVIKPRSLPSGVTWIYSL